MYLCFVLITSYIVLSITKHHIGANLGGNVDRGECWYEGMLVGGNVGRRECW